jgi:hypothetical protein
MIQVSSKLDALAYVFAPLLLEGLFGHPGEGWQLSDRGDLLLHRSPGEMASSGPAGPCRKPGPRTSSAGAKPECQMR